MDKIAILDFGGQYSHLIANRIRRFGVYTEILDGNISYKKLRGYKGIILSGGPASVNSKNSLRCNIEIFDLNIPILAICYGHQLTSHLLKGKVIKGKTKEYGNAILNFNSKKSIFKNTKSKENVWMNHFDQVIKPPKDFEIIASTSDCPIAVLANFKKNIFTMQFHPEVHHTPCGNKILQNFVKLTGAKKSWDMEKYIEKQINEIKEKCKNKNVFLLISGGVDSTVAFLLLDKALKQNKVYGLFVDTGLMRMNEKKQVKKALEEVGVKNLHIYEAEKEFLSALKDVFEPEEKRKIIGNLFLDVQAKVSEKLKLNPDEWFLGQGTIYPDTIETGGSKHSKVIKTHHNQVEKIKKLDKQGKIIEPLKFLYKDEVRKVGEKLGLSKDMVWRHPFPGPGLGVRILCSEKEDFPPKKEDLENNINLFIKDFLNKNENLCAKILPMKSVGVQGDERSYKHPVLLYGERLSWNRLSTLSTHLTNHFDEINRVVFGLHPYNFDNLTIRKNYIRKERILTIQKADKTVMDYLFEVNIINDIWQFPTVLIPLSVGNTNSESIVLRPICSQEAMTANFYHMQNKHLNEIVKRLKSLKEISGIFYDITNKPPGTI